MICCSILRPEPIARHDDPVPAPLVRHAAAEGDDVVAAVAAVAALAALVVGNLQRLPGRAE